MPLAPIGLSPWGGQIITASTENIFSWQQDGTQAAYYVEYVRNIQGATVFNTGWVGVSTPQHTFPANTFTNTYEYKWRAKIRNVSGQESVFSEWAVFKAGNPIAILIIFPANDYDHIITMPIYQHEYNNPNGYSQLKYRYQVYTGATWDDFDALTAAQQESMTWDGLELYGGLNIWDSGEVSGPAGSATSVEQPNGFFIPGEYWYKVRVTIWDTAGNQKTSDLRTFHILLDDIPKVPIISSATPDRENGQITISFINPVPDPGQVSAAYNRLYRKQVDGTWLLLKDNILSSPVNDNTFASGKQEEYAVSAVGTNDIESNKSGSVMATCKLNAYWIVNTVTGESVKLKADPQWGRMQSERDREEYVGQDEKFPGIVYGSKRFYRGSFKAKTLKPAGVTWEEYVSQIRAVLDPETSDKVPVLFRTVSGDIYKVDIYDLTITPIDRMGQAKEIGFSFVETEEASPAGSYTYTAPPAPPNPIRNFWVVDPDTGLGFELRANPSWGDVKPERDRAENIGLGQKMPSIGYGNKKAVRSGFSGWLVKTSSSDFLPETLRKLREFIDGDSGNKKPLLFIANTGEQFLVDVYGFSFELTDQRDNARQVAFEFVEVGDAGEVV